MKILTVTETPVKGEIKIDLGKRYRGSIGLVEVSLPFYELKDSTIKGYQLDITCPDIDCCLLNQERLLRRLLLPKPNWAKSYFKTIEFKNTLFQQIDTSSRYISILLLKEDGTAFEFPPNLFYSKVTLVLALTNENKEQSWVFRNI